MLCMWLRHFSAGVLLRRFPYVSMLTTTQVHHSQILERWRAFPHHLTISKRSYARLNTLLKTIFGADGMTISDPDTASNMFYAANDGTNGTGCQVLWEDGNTRYLWHELVCFGGAESHNTLQSLFERCGLASRVLA